MYLIQCDRCSKPIQEGEGYRFDIYTRETMNSQQMIGGVPHEWMKGEICSGCYNLLHFFFLEKFHEDISPGNTK